MRIAIIGSRDYPDLAQVRSYVLALPRDTVIVSGGASGVDSTAELAALDAGMERRIYRPNYATHGRRAPLIRNELIVRDCNRLVAFWANRSAGTRHTLGIAKRIGVMTETWMPGRDVPTRSVKQHCTCEGPFGCDVHDNAKETP